MAKLSNLQKKAGDSKLAAPRIVPCFHSVGIGPTDFAVDLAKAMRYSGTLVPQVLHERSCYVDTARNKLVRTFLSIPPAEATHLLMMDVDISFPPDAFLKTFHVMEACGADALYVNYCLGNNANSIFGPPENTANEAAVLVKLKPNQIYGDVGTGGTGWLMIRRELLERMQKELPGPWHWFARDLTHDGSDYRGEDVSFGLRCWKMNPRPKVMASTHVLLRHNKTQPFIPDFMAPVAQAEKVPAMAMPNPYENDPENFHIVGNSVVHKRLCSPEELARIQKEVLQTNAESVRSDEGRVCGGSSSGQPEVQCSPEQSGGDLQLEAPGKPGDGQAQEAQEGQPTDGPAEEKVGV